MTFTPIRGDGTIRAVVAAYVSSDPTDKCTPRDPAFQVAERVTVLVPTTETVHLTWPTPVIWSAYVPAKGVLCVSVSAVGPPGFELDVAAVGFKL